LTTADLEEAARIIEAQTDLRKLTRKQRQEQAARVRRFLAFPPELQEGILRYGENIRGAYTKRT